jgi:hypothetical protein
MEGLIFEALRLLDASKEIVPLMVVFMVLQMQAIKGRLIRVETILEK